MRYLLLSLAIYGFLAMALCPLMDHHLPELLPGHTHLIPITAEHPHWPQQVPHSHGQATNHQGAVSLALIPMEAATGILGLVGVALLSPLWNTLVAPLAWHPIWPLQKLALRGRNPTPQPRPPADFL